MLTTMLINTWRTEPNDSFVNCHQMRDKKVIKFRSDKKKLDSGLIKTKAWEAFCKTISSALTRDTLNGNNH